MTEEEMKRIDALVRVYFDADEFDKEDIIHLLTDLRHLCAHRGWVFGEVSFKSNEYYQAEKS
jgi:hypothetical protein